MGTRRSARLPTMYFLRDEGNGAGVRSVAKVPLRATDLAITRTSVMGVQPRSVIICPSSLGHDLLLLQSWIDQRQISCRIKPLLQLDRIDRNHHFQRRGYIRIKNMATACCSIGVSNYHVRMDHGLSLIERDIAAHPNHFVLAVDGNLLVHLALGIEPSQRSSIKCSNSGEMSARNLIFLRKL